MSQEDEVIPPQLGYEDWGNGKLVADEDGIKWVEFANGRRLPTSAGVGTHKEGWMCRVDWECEVGRRPMRRIGRGTPNYHLEAYPHQFFDTLEDLRATRECVKGCGWVKLVIMAVEEGK